MHLNMICISRYIAKLMYLEKPKRLIIWDGGGNWQLIFFNISYLRRHAKAGARVSHTEIFGFQNVIKTKNGAIIFL